MSGYTVIDLETTGLFPQKHDRVVEVGVVYVSDQGEVQGEWCTLVNPERDVGPTSLHGISAREALSAPTFSRIAPHLLKSISGRTIVAHDARFDLQFLDYEFDRAHLGTRPPTPGLCTMQWSAAYISAASRKLADCCRGAGVQHGDEHTALGDARAAAGLLQYYLRACGVPIPWSDLVSHTRGYWWPPVEEDGSEVQFVGRSTEHRRPDAWLERISSHLPRNDDPVVEAYLDVLEHAMLDRYLSAHEEQALIEVALALGLQRDQLAAVHATYLDSLAAAALADGVVTDEERRELDEVAGMLGLPRRLASIALDRASSGPLGKQSGLHLDRGDRVVFTGELSISRDEWVARAARAGLEHGSVTKRTKVVVAGDPDSQSGKAAKARSYNIPVVSEAAFSRLLDELATSGR